MSETKKNTTTPESTTTPEITKAPKVKKVKILLPRLRGQNEDVFVSVNNYTCVIKRGVEVEVPVFVKEVLDHQEQMLETIQAFEDQVRK